MTVAWGGGGSGGPFRIGHTWAVSGFIQPPLGAEGFIPGFYVPVLGGSTVQLVEVSSRCRGGGPVFFNLTQNGGTIAAYTSGTVGDTTGLPVGVADNDYFELDVTSVSSVPDGLTVTLIFEITP